ncbi:hypothetical protein DN050_02150 [Heyndrickxia coagulans]|nr:hypothetical protein DN050_02150 [Heyndrickxia coagulans]
MTTLTFFMEKKHSLPDKSIAKGVIDKLKKSNGLPPGNYAVYIKSNEILKRRRYLKMEDYFEWKAKQPKSSDQSNKATDIYSG